MEVPQKIVDKVFQAMVTTKQVHCDRIAKIVGCTKQQVIYARAAFSQEQKLDVAQAIMTRKYYVGVKKIMRLTGLTTEKIKSAWSQLPEEEKGKIRELIAKQNRRNSRRKPQKQMRIMCELLGVCLAPEQMARYLEIKKLDKKK